MKVFGADQNAIENSARVIAKEVAKIPGMVDVFDGLVLSNPQEEVLIDETAAQRYALDAEEIQSVLRTVVEGTVATRLPVGDRLYDVLVRYPDEYHQNLGLLPTVLLKTADGGAVPLSAVATLRWLGEQSELDRERMRPVVRVTARVEGIDLGTAMARAKLRLAALRLPAGVSLEYGGLYSDQQKVLRPTGSGACRRHRRDVSRAAVGVRRLTPAVRLCWAPSRYRGKLHRARTEFVSRSTCRHSWAW